MSEHITAETMKLNEVQPEGFCTPAKSLIHEVEKLREAVLMLCELQREVNQKVEAALHPINTEAA